MKDEILKLVSEGHNKSYIRDLLQVSEYQVTEAKRELKTDQTQGKPSNLPPTEQAIQMLENGYSKQEVQEAWGVEVLAEALSFYEIPSVEEYIKQQGI